MSSYRVRHSVSTVTALVAAELAPQVVNGLLEKNDLPVLTLDARGSVLHDHWSARLLPTISPSMRVIHTVIPDQEVESVMQTIVETADLRKPGSGAVFTIPCEDFVASEDYPKFSEVDDPEQNLSTGLKENLSLIVVIIHGPQSDSLSRSALRSGTHGPVTHFCEGRGLRDRIGWLRITRVDDMEIMYLLVDDVEVEAVFETLVSEGRFDLPGRGVIYRMPVRQGVVNLPGVIASRRSVATTQQLVAAIDELKGGTAWRAQEVQNLGAGGGRTAGMSLFARRRVRYHRGQVCLSCICLREDAELLMDAALDGGAQGVNVSYSRLTESHSEALQPGSARLNTEEGLLRSIILPEQIEQVRSHMQAVADAKGITNLCFYTQPVVFSVSYRREE